MDYYVSILNEEDSPLADVISITGTVNTIHVSAKVRISSLKHLKAKEVKLLKQKALIEAFEARTSGAVAAAGGEKVTV